MRLTMYYLTLLILERHAEQQNGILLEKWQVHLKDSGSTLLVNDAILCLATLVSVIQIAWCKIK